MLEAFEPFLKGDSGRKTRGLLRLIILLTIAGAAVASRLFSVIRKLFRSPTSKLHNTLRHSQSSVSRAQEALE